LGKLEEIAVRLCAMQRTLEPTAANPTIFVFAADHGVCAEGVNPYPQSVTRQMLANFLAGGAAINAVAESVGASLMLVDAGVAGPGLVHSSLLSRRVAAATRNFCQEPAMSEAEALRGLEIGMECADNAVRGGSTVLAIGEMGIGNTTVASALCAAITKKDAELVCGPGTGSDEAALQRKKVAVRRALALHNREIATPLELLARLGGFEIAAMCGVCIAAARSGCAVLIDGFISTAAAALAGAMNQNIRDYLIAAHQSPEPGHRFLLEFLGLDPILRLDMRLGEGTGAALVIPIVRAAIATFRCMATFDTAGVAQSLPHSSR
jgi:nicotinate-nucleotide--dimethylbenzimidazole phosphoribosyltransferase